MRQAGVIAAAGIVALDEMVDRLAEDHVNARLLAEGLARIPGLSVHPVHTNVVLFRVKDEGYPWPALVAAAARAGVALSGFGHDRIRAVTHAGVGAHDVEAAVAIIERLLAHGPGDRGASPVLEPRGQRAA